jgi:hypothetical protein
MAYATVAELIDYMGPLPYETTNSEAQRLLNLASDDIDVATIGCWYSTDANGNPTEANVISAFKKAACAHVSFLLETGDIQGVSMKYNTVTIGDVSLSGGRSATTSGANNGVFLAPRAVSALMVAGLLPAFPYGVG